MEVHIGITGTRSGMNERQRDFVVAHLHAVEGPSVHFHHGDCVGVDIQAAQIAKDAGIIVIGHPPIKTELRGYFPDAETREPKGYFSRNRDIVDDSNYLLVVPWQNEWYNSGGTWYTHDYAKKIGKDFIIVWPDKEAETFFRE